MKLEQKTTQGETERHRVTVPGTKPVSLGPWVFAGLVVAGLCVSAVLFANGNEGEPAPLPQVTTPPAPTYTSEPEPQPQPEPMRVTRPERNRNDNDADHGSVNINGDQNRVLIDNSQTTHHHHRHETREVVAEYVVTPRLKRTQLRRDPVPQECNDSMAEHHETVARWYRQGLN